VAAQSDSLDQELVIWLLGDGSANEEHCHYW